MSYDIVVFDPAAVTDSAFPDWYERQAEWSEEHGYMDSAVTTPELRAFYTELIEEFPAMNGPDAPDYETLEPEVEARLTDYSIGEKIVCGAFSWPQARRAETVVRELAARHNVAVAWVSDASRTMPITRPREAGSTHSITNLAGASFLGAGETLQGFQSMFSHLDVSTRGLQPLGQDELFIQAAGSADRLCVEIRAEVDGVVDLHVIGRPPARSGEGPPDVVIPFGSHSTRVYENEVFDGAEAAVLFFRYYESGDVPAGFSLRALGFA